MTRIQPGLYRHFKGFLCEVFGVAKHSESQEELVIYRHDGQLWARPLSMFVQTVEKDGQTVPRFTYLGKLVRDNIPDIIKAEGRQPQAEVADQQEYNAALLVKLAEEVEEYRRDQTPEELADLYEVIDAICAQKGYTADEIKAIQTAKREKRGGFSRRVILK